MRSTLLLAQVKLVLALFVSFAAYAADSVIQTAQRESLESITMYTWLFLLLFASVGWVIVHLDALVEWAGPKSPETWEEHIALKKARLKIVQGYVASVSAGIAFFLLIKGVPDWFGMTARLPDMVIFVGTVPAAMGGTATWQWIQNKFMGGKPS